MNKRILGFFSFLVLSAFVAQLNKGVSSRSPASGDVSDLNKSDLPSGIFTDPPEGGFFQIAAGMTDAAIATYLIRSSSKAAAIIPLEAQMMNDAREDLLRAHKWPTTEAAKKEMIAAREAHLEKVRTSVAESGGKGLYHKIDLKKAEAALQEAREMTLLTEKAKRAMVLNAEKALSESRAAGIEAVAAKSGKFAKTIRSVKVIGGVLFIGDALGRVYVWNVVDASPNLSPGASVFKKYTYDQIKDLLFNKKSSGLVDSSVPENPSNGSAASFLEEFEKQHDAEVEPQVEGQHE